jgi:hypothetical protein
MRNVTGDGGVSHVNSVETGYVVEAGRLELLGEVSTSGSIRCCELHTLSHSNIITMKLQNGLLGNNC